MARAGDSEGQGGTTADHPAADKCAAGAETSALEQRSVHAEQDYRKKDAVRHIVADAASQKRGTNQMNDGNLKLMKLLTNLECVRKGKPMLKSEIGSVYSRKSRIS